MKAVKIGSSTSTVPSTNGNSVVNCTITANGPSSRRPVARRATMPAASALTSEASAQGRRMAKALCPKHAMLPATSHVPSGGFS